MNRTRVGTNTILLLLGDTIIFFGSLWAALTIRQFAVPQATFYVEHIYPFTILYVMWILIFFIAGLYDEELLTIKQSIADTVVTAQSIAAGLAVLMLYTIPFFGLTPKTNLAIFLIVFSFVIWQWRRYFFHHLRPPTREVVMVGNDKDLEHILKEKNFYGYSLIDTLKWKDILSVRKYPNDTILFVNYTDKEFAKHTEDIHRLVFEKYDVVNTGLIKERLFGRVDLQKVSYEWFITQISTPHRPYGFLKRAMDLCAGLVLFVIFVVTLPFVALAVYLEERSLDLFFIHTRIGLRGKPFKMYKLRSMRTKDTTTWDGSNYQLITKVGKVLRALRIDELPQSINLIRGEISLVGPRPIPPAEHEERNKDQEFYHLRLFVKPGITGWAQVKQRHAPTTTQEAEERLSYDLYYVKKKSFMFDAMIILRTVKTILLRAGLKS